MEIASLTAAKQPEQLDTRRVDLDQVQKDVWNQIQEKYGAKTKPQKEKKNGLDKDDFIKIMISQMKNQDPTKPFEADKLASEIAQITSVEQLSNVNRVLDKLSTQNRPLEKLTMTNLIGKTIQIDRNRFSHQKGDQESIPFVLGEDAKTVKMTIVSERGDVVFEKEIGDFKNGKNSYLWDGAKPNSLPAENGMYMVQIDARDQTGKRIQTESQGEAKIIGVSLRGGEPMFLVGDRNSYIRVPMENITEIQEYGTDPLASSDPVKKPETEAKSNPNFFTFKEGVGSEPIDPSALDPKAKEALRKYRDGESNSAPASKPALPKAEGFPNGLTENQDSPTEVKI